MHLIVCTIQLFYNQVILLVVPCQFSYKVSWGYYFCTYVLSLVLLYVLIYFHFYFYIYLYIWTDTNTWTWLYILILIHIFVYFHLYLLLYLYLWLYNLFVFLYLCIRCHTCTFYYTINTKFIQVKLYVYSEVIRSTYNFICVLYKFVQLYHTWASFHTFLFAIIVCLAYLSEVALYIDVDTVDIYTYLHTTMWIVWIFLNLASF